jgi:3-deoxy-manno-octulosonate cytidylyltransferase (CMP-KDO synthetase)
MRVLAVIPSRFGSTRFPGKPLALIAGKPLLQHVVEGISSAKKITQTCVATDDQRIYDLAMGLGATAVMTASELPTGTDRVWAAAKFLETQGLKFDVVVNVQGDEPLLTGDVVDALIGAFSDANPPAMATLGRRLKSEDLTNPNVAKVVLGRDGNALYFSRLAVPFTRTEFVQGQDSLVLKHIGIYSFSRSFLETFCDTKPCPLELAESLEQLRALWMGARIKIIPTEHESWGVDTPSDVVLVESKLKKLGR